MSEEYFALLSFSRADYESGFAAICCEYLKKIEMVNNSGARLCTPEECTFLGLTQWNGKPYENHAFVAPTHYAKFKPKLIEICLAAEDFKSGFFAHKKITDAEKSAREVDEAEKREAKAMKNVLTPGDLVKEKHVKNGTVYEVLLTSCDEIMIVQFIHSSEIVPTKRWANMVDFKKIPPALAKRFRFAKRVL